MKQRTLFFLTLVVLFVFFFALGKAGFLLYNGNAEAVTLSDALDIWWHGLSMDLSTTGYLVALPWLALLTSIAWKRMPLRAILMPYYIIVSILLSAIVVGDTVMYEFWKFKLDSTVFAYMGDTQGATNSVSLGFIALRLTAFALLAAATTWAAIRLTPRCLKACTHKLATSIAWLLLGGVTFLFIRGGWQESTMNVGVAYYSQRLYLNHAAVNPAFSLIASATKNKDFSKQFQYLPEAERAETFDPLYVQGDTTLTDTLLRTSRPNILLVLMESFGSQFVRELGGLPDVTPNLSRLIPEGVFWDNMYANSFRTDRGTVSAFSGWVSYPTVSLMRMPGRSATLPGLPHTLQQEGYSTHYLYGGDIKIMGKSGYLIAAGYEHLISDKDFSYAEINESKWGANDSVTAMRALQEIKRLEQSGKPWHFGLQTLNSHEPYEVPYHRLEDKVENAFAFTDHCVGMLIDSLRTLPAWNNMLVILLPDHGSTYQSSYQNPDFFHCPMLWLGGALRQPRRMNVLMNQSDVAATLLGQMHLPYDHFLWSRNVLSQGYTYPFAYCTYPGGIMFKDSTGTTVFDITSNTQILSEPSPDDTRMQRAKAILQTSYQRLMNH